MRRLSYNTLTETDYSGYLLREAPERMLQFGEGNFLRAFVDHFVDVMNEKVGFNCKVAVVQPRAPHSGSRDVKQLLTQQEGLYTLYLRGMEDGKPVSKSRVISCISRCLNAYEDFDALLSCADQPLLRFITCNTTEAGIVYDPSCGFSDRPAASFPAKLTQLLYRRFQRFGHTPGRGFIILACELIDNNGRLLQDCVLRHAADWELGDDFSEWIRTENLFCSTLVDRIVTGYPAGEAQKLRDEWGWEDGAMVAGETFGFWVIEGPDSLREELPFDRAGLPVLITEDHRPYKQRKVRILNGAHTCLVPGAFLAGQNIVRDCMTDPVLTDFMNRALYREIIPTLDLPPKELEDFAHAVRERFANPFIDHALLSICLNCTSKWKARVLPSLLEYHRRTGELPACLTASLACCAAFYLGVDPDRCRLSDAGLTAYRSDGTAYTVSDDPKVLSFYFEHRKDSPAELAGAVAGCIPFWDRDLNLLPGFTARITDALEIIRTRGAYTLLRLTAGCPE